MRTVKYWHEDSNLSENDVALGRLPAPRKLLLFAWFDMRRTCYLHVRYAMLHIVCTNASYTY